MIPRRARSIALAGVLSVLAHLLLFAIPRSEPLPPPLASAPGPLTVELRPPAPPPPPPEPRAQPTAPAPPAPSREPPPPRASPPPRAPEAPVAPPVETPAPPTPPPQPAPARPSTPPPADMMAALEAKRAQREAEAAAAKPPLVEKALPDPATRNLQTLTGREGVGGVFQILRMSRASGAFAFRGWRADARSQWREVIEVEVRPGDDIELAMVRRMISLIRSHYTGDFYWESHRLGRTVTLSARPEDTQGLEDFLMREFFGQPVLNPR